MAISLIDRAPAFADAQLPACELHPLFLFDVATLPANRPKLDVSVVQPLPEQSGRDVIDVVPNMAPVIRDPSHPLPLQLDSTLNVVHPDRYSAAIAVTKALYMLFPCLFIVGSHGFF